MMRGQKQRHLSEEGEKDRERERERERRELGGEKYEKDG